MSVQSELERGMAKRIVGYGELTGKVSDIIFEHDSCPHIWLDTGCGTGGLIRSNLQRFPKCQFVLSDPSADNIAIAKELMHGEQRCLYVTKATHELNFGERTLDVVTAMFCHHYYEDLSEKKNAISNCFRMLKDGGMFITAEHVRHEDQEAADKEWISFMKGEGLPEEFAKEMISRRDKEYFPMTESALLVLLKECGFSEVKTFWSTCSDIGIIAFK